MEDIHEIKPLLDVAFPWLALLLALGLMLLALLLVGWWVRRLLKRRRTQPDVPLPKPKPKVPPRESALAALKKLKPQAEQSERFYLQLEQILKQFLADLHELPVTSYTSQQLLSFLQANAHPPLQDFQLENLLKHGQYAKFARSSQQLADMQADLQAAQDFVQRYTARQ